MHKIFKIQYEKLLSKFFKGTSLKLTSDINDICNKVYKLTFNLIY